jgi:hypothetical protein
MSRRLSREAHHGFDMSTATRDLKGVWALAWRSLNYFPLALAISALLLSAIIAPP